MEVIGMSPERKNRGMDCAGPILLPQYVFEFFPYKKMIKEKKNLIKTSIQLVTSKHNV